MSVLTRGFARKTFAADQVVFAQDDESNGVFCVLAALIALRTHNPNGTSTLLKLAYPCEVIGFRSFLAKAKHKTEARALLPSRVCVVAQRDANNVVRGNPAVLERLVVRRISEIGSTKNTSLQQRRLPTNNEFFLCCNG